MPTIGEKIRIVYDDCGGVSILNGIVQSDANGLYLATSGPFVFIRIYPDFARAVLVDTLADGTARYYFCEPRNDADERRDLWFDNL